MCEEFQVLLGRIGITIRCSQGPGRVVSVWVESTEQMIAGALIPQRLNKTEGRKAASGASVISCQKKPPTSCEWEMTRWNARKYRG